MSLRSVQVHLYHAPAFEAQLEDAELLLAPPTECDLWILVGIPGAGKSTFASAAPQRQVVSVDEIRRKHGWPYGSPDWLYAYHLAYQATEEALQGGTSVVFDATGLYDEARGRLQAIASEHQVPVRAVILSTDAERCMDRDGRRGEPVGESFSHHMRILFDRTVKEYLLEEDYASLHYLDETEQDALLAAWRSR